MAQESCISSIAKLLQSCAGLYADGMQRRGMGLCPGCGFVLQRLGPLNGPVNRFSGTVCCWSESGESTEWDSVWVNSQFSQRVCWVPSLERVKKKKKPTDLRQQFKLSEGVENPLIRIECGWIHSSRRRSVGSHMLNGSVHRSSGTV